MGTVRVIYVSTAKASLEYVLRLAKLNGDRNSEREISSLLMYSRDYFCQVLDGPIKEVLPLIAKIAQNEMHSDLIVKSVETNPINVLPRRGVIFAGSPRVQNLSKKIYGRKFNPYMMDSSAILRFALGLSTAIINGENATTEMSLIQGNWDSYSCEDGSVRYLGQSKEVG